MSEPFKFIPSLGILREMESLRKETERKVREVLFTFHTRRELELQRLTAEWDYLLDGAPAAIYEPSYDITPWATRLAGLAREGEQTPLLHSREGTP